MATPATPAPNPNQSIARASAKTRGQLRRESRAGHDASSALYRARVPGLRLPRRRVPIGEPDAFQLAVRVVVPRDVDSNEDNDGDDGSDESVSRQGMADQRGHKREPGEKPDRLKGKRCPIDRHDKHS